MSIVNHNPKLIMSQIRLDLPKVRLKFSTEPSETIDPNPFPEYDPGPAVFMERLKMSREMQAHKLRGRKLKRNHDVRTKGSRHMEGRSKVMEGRLGEAERHSMVKRRAKQLSTEFELAREGQHCTISQEETASLVRRERTKEYCKELQSHQRPRHFFRRDRGKSSIESMPLIQQHTSLPPELSGEKLSMAASPLPSKHGPGSPKKLYRHFRRREGLCPTVLSSFQLDPWQSKVAPSVMGDSTEFRP